MTAVRARVNKGAAWLTRVFPDWRRHINISALDVYGANTVLGQLAAKGFSSLVSLPNPHKWEACGFIVPSGVFNHKRFCAELREEWIKQITKGTKRVDGKRTSGKRD